MGASSKCANSAEGGEPRSAWIVCATSAKGDTGQRDNIERRICAAAQVKNVSHLSGADGVCHCDPGGRHTCSTYAFGIRWSCTAYGRQLGRYCCSLQGQHRPELKAQPKLGAQPTS